MQSETGPYGVTILAVSSAPDPDGSGRAAASMFDEAGHRIVDHRTIQGDHAAVQTAVRNAAANDDCRIILITGGAGFAASDNAPEAVLSMASTPVPGFAALFQMVSYRDAGAGAQFVRAAAGLVGPTVTFVVPGTPEDVALAVGELILPEMTHYVAIARTGDSVSTPNPAAAIAAASGAQVPGASDDGDDDVVDAEVEDVDDDVDDDDGPTLPPPEPRWSLGAGGMGITAEPMAADAPAADDDDTVPDKGWKRAVYDLEAEVLRGKGPDIPFHIEDLAPAMDVLHQAGEVARLKLPNGNMPTIYGYPDLQRPGSKVLLVGWGEPHGEVVALHRYPVQAGLSIDEDRGLMPGRDSDIAHIAKAVTGRVPPDPSGELYAVDHDAVYIQRGKWIYRWDGRRERKEGNTNQTLATLLIAWHGR